MDSCTRSVLDVGIPAQSFGLLKDAHEFLNHLLLRVSEILEKEQRMNYQNGIVHASTSDSTSAQPTWVQEIFEGKLVHETKCLRCETVTSREEVFMDLQLAIEHNCSLTSCLKRYRFFKVVVSDLQILGF